MNIFQGQNGLFGVEDENGILTDAIFSRAVAIHMAEFGQQVADFYSQNDGQCDKTDPRANLRRCSVRGHGTYFFHQWASDSDGEARAIVEDITGKVDTKYARHIRFTDVPAYVDAGEFEAREVAG